MKVRVLNLLFCAGLIATTWPTAAAQAQFNFGIGRPSQGQPARQSPSSNYPTRPQSPSLFDLDIFRDRTPRTPRPPKQLSEREAYEKRIAEASPADAVREVEAYQASQFSRFLGIATPTQTPTAAAISLRLAQIAQETGKKPALLYPVALKEETHLLLVLPSASPWGQRQPQSLVASLHLTPTLLAQTTTSPVIRQIVGDVSREDVLDIAKSFRQEVSNPTKLDSTEYLESAEKLYRWIVSPIEPQLKAQGIDTLLFSMDDGLRAMPIAALNNGRQYLVEQYSSALIPSFGLTQTPRSLAISQQPMLAMGISKSTEGLAPLPMVSTEIAAITGQFWSGPSRNTLDEASTLSNLKDLYLQQRFGVLHLATHAMFNTGQVDHSFIQFWNDRLTLPKIRQLSQDLQWQNLPPLQLLVLSACQTALGSKEAELGFAGTALNSGVPSAIASLWAVDDQGSLGLMAGFYDALPRSIKAEALRQAQLQMLRGQVRLSKGQMALPNHPPISLSPGSDAASSLTHPYFWAGFTTVGNWN